MRTKYFNLWGRQIISSFVFFTFSLSTISSMPNVYAQNMPHLPNPGTMVPLSQAFSPAVIKGIKVDLANPFKFEFIMDLGQSGLKGESLKQESETLIKYFLASLTIPEEDLWVNLSPYEKDRIIPEAFGRTEMGQDLLAQDYLLKQITSSLMYPEGQTGKRLWERIYKEAYTRHGTTDVPINTFNKVWILPDQASVYENKEKAFIVEQNMKVMLDRDYFALNQNSKGHYDPKVDEMTSLSENMIREIILPVIQEEVNTGEHFAKLRQIYHSMILATWFKKNLKESLLGQGYVDRGKVRGVDTEDKDAKQKIYDRYLQAFKAGVYDYIKEEYDPLANAIVSQKYFSGGIAGNVTVDEAVLSDKLKAQWQNPQGLVNVVSFVDGVKGGEGDEAMVVGLWKKFDRDTMNAFQAHIDRLAEGSKRFDPEIKGEQIRQNYENQGFSVPGEFAELYDLFVLQLDADYERYEDTGYFEEFEDIIVAVAQKLSLVTIGQMFMFQVEESIDSLRKNARRMNVQAQLSKLNNRLDMQRAIANTNIKPEEIFITQDAVNDSLLEAQRRLNIVLKSQGFYVEIREGWAFNDSQEKPLYLPKKEDFREGWSLKDSQEKPSKEDQAMLAGDSQEALELKRLSDAFSKMIGAFGDSAYEGDLFRASLLAKEIDSRMGNLRESGKMWDDWKDKRSEVEIAKAVLGFIDEMLEHVEWFNDRSAGWNLKGKSKKKYLKAANDLKKKIEENRTIAQKYLSDLASIEPEKVDQAMGTTKEKPLGGIDLHADHLNLKTEGRGGNFDLTIDEAMLAEMISADGLMPVVTTITPVTNLLLELGLNPLIPIMR